MRKTKGAPNPHLYNSLAVLAGESGFVEEARAWFKQGTSSVRVSRKPVIGTFERNGSLLISIASPQFATVKLFRQHKAGIDNALQQEP